jgi:hypothetical protein
MLVQTVIKIILHFLFCVYIFYFFVRLIRPVANSSDRLTVHMRLKLSQVIGVVSTVHIYYSLES